jgi:hypothetical protein
MACISEVVAETSYGGVPADIAASACARLDPGPAGF